ncbi:DGQHR domain-containing protein [Burkholderia gladioli]|uniref:DGQHR domain-containing protein n=1 Tax=Burkholderia gladioli TaxID=28095 RepID=UPI000F520AC0|nr:DGQHR domain-containing protein [Burkholderia gladioli]
MATKTLNKKFRYPALSYKQRNSNNAPEFLLFHAPASEILDWADVERLSPDSEKGAQRPLRELRVRKVAKYFNAEPTNTIPTAVIIALDKRKTLFTSENEESGIGHVNLEASNTRKPGLIIDGQHRVHGAAAFDPDTRLNIVAFLGGNDAEQAFQFVVINNTGVKVSKDHIKALNLNYDADQLNKRLVKSAGVALGLSDSDYDDLQVINGTEPFGGILDLPTNVNGFVAPSAAESALQRVRDNARHLGIEGLERDVFLDMWTLIKNHYADAWSQPANDQNLLKKVSLYALTEFLLEAMRGRLRVEKLDYTENGVMDNVIGDVLNRIPAEFWTSAWKAKELDTSAGRQILLDTLTAIESNSRFGRAWYDTIRIIDASLLSKTKSPAKSKAKEKEKRSPTKSGAKNSSNRKTMPRPR